MSWAQTVVVIGTLVAVVGAQAFWIGRALDAMSERVARIEDKLDTVLVEHGQRLSRVEGATS